MNYCSHCGSDLLVFDIPAGDNRQRYICKNCDTIHYANPKVVAGCLPIWEDKVLLCRRAIEPRLGFWNIPAGYLENGETVEQGALREVWEEAEASVHILGVLTLFSIPHINQVYIHFLGQMQNLDYGIGIESLEVALFTEDEIPWSDIAFKSSEFALRRYFQDRKNGGLQQAHIGSMDYKK